MLRAFVELEALDGIVLSTTVPQLAARVRVVRGALGGRRAARARAGRADGRADPLRRPARGRPGPDRERGRRARAPRRAGDRRRLRHLDELRRRLGRGRVRRRRARARDRDLDGRAVRARRAADEGAVRRAGARDRQDDRRRRSSRASSTASPARSTRSSTGSATSSARRDAPAIATGGLAELIAPHSQTITTARSGADAAGAAARLGAEPWRSEALHSTQRPHPDALRQPTLAAADQPADAISETDTDL